MIQISVPGWRTLDLRHLVLALNSVVAPDGEPTTGVDVMRIRLIEDLEVEAETEQVRSKVRLLSPLCPLAVTLALSIRQAVAEVPGVTDQEIDEEPVTVQARVERIDFLKRTVTLVPTEES